MSAPIRAMTYNIRKGKGPDGRSNIGMPSLASAVLAHEPDLVLFQEVFHCARTGLSQSGKLARAMGLPGYYGANKFRSVGHHGNTTVTRLSVQEFDNHDISTNRIERRGALYLRLDLHGQPLHVLNVHLGLNRWQRKTQIRSVAEILRRVARDQDPVLLAGDFNDWRGELDRPIAEELRLHNLFARHPPEQVRTWHARRPVFNLDRIYVRHLRAERARRLDGEPWSELSDHLPLIADLWPT
ncbi:MAG: endonuclease/exonuclease/phosphatase family protein [Myxococcales bacterium]|nr:endonuclease/exonuclease/phosphatase family protein [Myxococcales bacterium]